MEVSDSRRAARALLDEECDLAFVGAVLRDARIEWLPFATDEIIVVGPARGPHAAPPSLPRGGLATVPLVLREHGSGTRDAIASLLPAGDRGAARPPTIEVGSSEAARRCVLEGIGYTLISRTAVADDLQAGRLREVKLPGTPARRSFHVGRLRGVTMPAGARALLELATPSRRKR
jgi:DNA-binding transcriptional LysR family regulator